MSIIKDSQIFLSCIIQEKFIKAKKLFKDNTSLEKK